MKKLFFLIFCLIISGCQSRQSLYTEKQQEILRDADVLDYAENSCEQVTTLQMMLDEGAFEKEYIEDYCRMELTSSKHVNFLLDQGLNDEDVIGFSTIPYFRDENITRYLEADGSYEERVLAVNMNMDLEPFETTSYVSDFSDMTLLVNKFNALPEGYVPDDMVDVKYVCVQGVDYSCTTMDQVVLRQEAEEAFERFVESALEEKGISIVVIAAYRSYQYQKDLYNYYLPIYGQERTDQYYARPGQSEHNSGLAVDITFDHIRYTDIESHEAYPWILENMHRFGFILRYPEDKQKITRYGYESWHLRYVGVEAATTMYENNWCLEEYLARK